jgi:hypothetical protein
VKPRTTVAEVETGRQAATASQFKDGGEEDEQLKQYRDIRQKACLVAL